ncbi:hypothetical protein JCM6882_007635 [Rhodosporidiobolus microsporus]
MLLPRLFGLDLDGTNSSSILTASASSSASSSILAPLSTQSIPIAGAAAKLQASPISTTTVFKVIYVVAAEQLPSFTAAAASGAGSNSTSLSGSAAASTSTSSVDAQDAAQKLLSDADGGGAGEMSLLQINGVILSLFFTTLVLTVMVAFFLRSAQSMRQITDGGGDDGNLSELGLGGGKGERRGLLGGGGRSGKQTTTTSEEDSSSSSDGDEDVKL